MPEGGTEAFDGRLVAGLSGCLKAELQIWFALTPDANDGKSEVRTREIKREVKLLPLPDYESHEQNIVRRKPALPPHTTQEGTGVLDKDVLWLFSFVNRIQNRDSSTIRSRSREFLAIFTQHKHSSIGNHMAVFWVDNHNSHLALRRVSAGNDQNSRRARSGQRGVP
jgi:hypothetical protein